MLQVRPSLLLDFINSKQLDPRVVFQRASSATRINRNGNLEVVAANAPRFDYEPVDVPILGPELVINGGFADASSWTSGVATIAASGGELQVTSTGAVYGYARQTLTVETGKTYRISGRGRLGTANLAWIIAGTAGDALAYSGTTMAINSASYVSKSMIFTAQTTLLLLTLENNNAVADATSFFDDISVREVIGYSARKGDCKGLLVEEARTNLILNSEGVAATYVGNPASYALASTSITGFANSIQVPAGATASTPYKSIATTTGGTYSFSCYVAMDDGSIPVVTASSGPLTDFSIQANNVALAATSITPVGGGVYRISLSFVSTGWPTVGVVRYDTQTGKGFRVTGYQLEQGEVATSYIPTTTAQATRAADVATIKIGTSWFNWAAMTVFAEFSEGTDYTSAGNCVASISDGSTNNQLYVGQRMGISTLRSGAMDVGGAGSTQFLLTHAVPSAQVGTLQRVAVALATGSAAGCANGSTVAVDNTVSVSPDLTVIRLGSASPGIQFLNGYVRKVAYFPTALVAQELQEITA